MTDASLPAPRPIVKKSQSEGIFKNTWYVKAFGRVYRRDSWQDAIELACFIAPKHIAWVGRLTNRFATGSKRKEINAATLPSNRS